MPEENPFHYLCRRFKDQQEGEEKDALALELLPYFMPKLRSVEMTAEVTTEFNVMIGGLNEG